MTKVAERSNAVSPVVREIVPFVARRAVSAVRGASRMTESGASILRFDGLPAKGKFSGFTKEDAASCIGSQSGGRLQVYKLEDGQ